MRLILAVIAFVATIGLIFIYDTKNPTGKTPADLQSRLQIISAQSQETTTGTPRGTLQSYTPRPASINTPTKQPDRTPLPQITLNYSPTPKATAVVQIYSPSPIPTRSPAMSVLSLTSPIKRGGNAKLEVKTISSSCKLGIILPSGTVSSANGLQGERVPDFNSTITWQWKISGSTNAGTANLNISCLINGATTNATLQMIITE